MRGRPQPLPSQRAAKLHGLAVDAHLQLGLHVIVEGDLKGDEDQGGSGDPEGEARQQGQELALAAGGADQDQGDGLRRLGQGQGHRLAAPGQGLGLIGAGLAEGQLPAGLEEDLGPHLEGRGPAGVGFILSCRPA